RVGDVEVVLDRGDERPDADDLGTQSQPREEQPREEAVPTPHYSEVTGFVIEPMPSISIVISSPGFMNRGSGFQNAPTPAGVPVAIRSPGWSVTVWVT